MQVISRIVARRPGSFIIAIIMVTALLGTSYVQLGGEMEASEEIFLPDTELVNSYIEIGDLYSATEPVQILVRSTNGDVLTQQSLLEMLEIERALLEDDDIGNTLATPDTPEESVTSVADLIVLGNMTLEAKQQFLDILESLTPVLGSLSFEGFEALLFNLDSSASSCLFILGSNASTSVKENASKIFVNEIELLNLAATLNLSKDINLSSMAFIGNLTYILNSTSTNSVKKNATHMILSQMELATLMDGSTSGGGSESWDQMTTLSAMFDPLNTTLSDPTLTILEKQRALHGIMDILTMQIESYHDSTLLFTGLSKSLSMVHENVSTGDDSIAANVINDIVGTPNTSGLSQNATLMTQLNTSLTANLNMVTNFINNPTPTYAKETQENLTQLINALRHTSASAVEMDALRAFNDTLTLYQVDPSNITNLNIALGAGQQALGLLSAHHQSISQGILIFNGLVYGLESLRDGVILNNTLPTPVKEDAVQSFMTQIQENMTLTVMAKGFLDNLRGTLSDLDHILASQATDTTKNHAMSIMTSELASFNALPPLTPPDPNMTALMDNFSETLISLYTILTIETDQPVLDHTINIVVNEFMLMETPMDTGGSMTMLDLGGELDENMFSISTDIDNKTTYLQENMTGDSVKQTLHGLLNYDPTADEQRITKADTAVAHAMTELTTVEHTLTRLVSNLHALEDNLTDPAEKVTVRGFSTGFEENLTLMTEATTGMQMLDAGLGATSMMDGMIQALGFSIPMLVTKEFDPRTTEPSAVGTIIVVQLDASKLPGEDSDVRDDRFLELERKIESIVGDMDHPNTRTSVLGMHAMSQEIIDASMDSMMILLPLAGLLVIIILALIYHNIPDIVFSVLALGFAIIWVFGISALHGFVLNPLTIAVPVLIVGLGIDYGIHMTLRYKEERSKGEDPKQASEKTILSVGAALLLATATTVIGFLSNIGTDVGVLREFSILCAVGIAASFLIMVTFIPACKQIVDTRKEKRSGTNEENTNKNENNNRGNRIELHIVKESGVSIINRALGFGAVSAERHPIPVIAVVLMITGASAIGALGLSTEFAIEDFLPEDLEVAQTMTYLSDNFNFSLDTATILIKGDITQPEVLSAINHTTQNMIDDNYVSKTYGRWGEQPDTTSILTLIWNTAEDQRASNPQDVYSPEFHSMVDGNDTNNDGIPDTNIETLFAWLYTNESTQNQVKQVLHRTDSGRYDGTVIHVNVDTKNDRKTGEMQSELENDVIPLNDLLEDGRIQQVTVTGMSIVMHVMLAELTESMQQSLVITLLLCFIMLTTIFYLLKRSWVLGALATIPVALCVVWILGSMYLLGIPYSILTVSITALTIGLGITYGIHIVHRFLEDIQEINDIDEACRHSIRHTGSALFGAAITTIAGFGLLMFSLLPPMQQFGGIIALTILYSFMASIFVLPTLLVMWAKWTKEHEINEKTS